MVSKNRCTFASSIGGGNDGKALYSGAKIEGDVQQKGESNGRMENIYETEKTHIDYANDIICDGSLKK